MADWSVNHVTKERKNYNFYIVHGRDSHFDASNVCLIDKFALQIVNIYIIELLYLHRGKNGEHLSIKNIFCAFFVYLS